MSTYPDLVQTKSSSTSFDDDVRIERASNGVARTRTMWTTRVQKFSITHILNRDDTQTLLNFHAANRGQPFYFVWSMDYQTYEVIFSSAPRVTPQGADVYSVSVDLEIA
jgi:hypothetical protein